MGKLDAKQPSLTNRVLAGDPEAQKDIESIVEDLLKAYGTDVSPPASPDARKPFLNAMGRRFVEQIPPKCAYLVQARDGKLAHSVRRGDDLRSIFRKDVEPWSSKSLYPDKLPPESNLLLRLFLAHGCRSKDDRGQVCLPRPELMEQALRELNGVLSPEDLLKRHAEELANLQQMLDFSEKTSIGFESYNVVANNLRKGVHAKTVQTARDWDGLTRQVSPQDLEYFDSASKDAVLTGELIVDPILLTGVHSVLRCAKTGEVVSLSLYNCMPIENTGQDLLPSCAKWEAAKARFGMGKQLSIANPYIKVAMDGARTIRVDDPRDIRFLNEAPASVSAAKESGNAAIKTGRFEWARLAYRSCFDHAEIDDYAMLLNHRSANSLKMASEELDKRTRSGSGKKSSASAIDPEAKLQLLPLVHASMLDASAVLCLRPGHKKCWERYAECMSLLRQLSLGPEEPIDMLCRCLRERTSAGSETPFFPTSAGAVEEMQSAKVDLLAFGIAISINQATSDKKATVKPSDQEKPVAEVDDIVHMVKSLAITSAQQHKKQNYLAAKHDVSRALLLLSTARPLVQVLSNLAHVALKLGRDTEALSCAFAALRLCAYHGEYDLDEAAFVEALTTKRPLPTFVQPGFFAPLVEKATFRLVKAVTMLGTVAVFETVQALRPGFEWLKVLGLSSGAVHFDYMAPELELRVIDPVVGRGVYTTRDIKSGTTLGLQMGIGISFKDTRPANDTFFAPDLVSDEDCAAGIGLYNKIMFRLSEDVGLSWRLSYLYAPDHPLDSIYPEKLLQPTPYTYLMNRLAPVALPFLPPLPELAIGGADYVQSAAKVGCILWQNGHGVPIGAGPGDFQGPHGDRVVNNMVCSILPIVAMMNHASEKNCDIGRAEEGEDAMMVLVANKDIRKDEEVTSSYFADGARPLRLDPAKWGF